MFTCCLSFFIKCLLRSWSIFWLSCLYAKCWVFRVLHIHDNSPSSVAFFGHSSCLPLASLALPSWSPLLIPSHYLGSGVRAQYYLPFSSTCTHTFTPLSTSPNIMVLKAGTPNSCIQHSYAFDVSSGHPQGIQVHMTKTELLIFFPKSAAPQHSPT